jgi:hypothetical protein
MSSDAAQPADFWSQALAGVTLALAGAGLYRAWVTRPLPDEASLGSAYAIGLSVGALLGLTSALFIRHIAAVATAVIAAIVGGHAWAIATTSDIHTLFRHAVVDAVHQMQVYHVVLLAVCLGAWFLGHRILLRRKFTAH